MRTTQYTEAALRRNNYPHSTADQTLKLETWSQSFPAAELIERLTHRPMVTCAALARLAGFREVEAQ